MDDKKHWIVVEGRVQGPFTAQEFRQQSISPATFVKIEGMPDFKEAHEIEEVRHLFSFNKEFTAPQYFAGFDLRLLASVIDFFLVLAFVLMAEMLWVFLFPEQALLPVFLGGLLLTPFLKIIYQIFSETRQQASLGKSWLNIKVTDLNGQKPTFTMICKRNLLKMLSTLLLFTGYAYLFFNKRQQCLHDQIAHTLVIKDRLI